MNKRGLIHRYAKATENIVRLYSWRMAEGLTRRELSQRTGVSIKLIRDYEIKKRQPTVRNYNKIAHVCGWETITEQSPRSLSLKKVPVSCEVSPKLPVKTECEFEVGKSYRIYSRGASGGKCKTESWERTCEYMYEGMDGIHHKFREMRGNWTRTYTDAQLIGKQVEEVKR